MDEKAKKAFNIFIIVHIILVVLLLAGFAFAVLGIDRQGVIRNNQLINQYRQTQSEITGIVESLESGIGEISRGLAELQGISENITIANRKLASISENIRKLKQSIESANIETNGIGSDSSAIRKQVGKIREQLKNQLDNNNR